MMFTNSRLLAVTLALIALTSMFVSAQKRRDPLTADEVDQLREQAHP